MDDPDDPDRIGACRFRAVGIWQIPDAAEATRIGVGQSRPDGFSLPARLDAGAVTESTIPGLGLASDRPPSVVCPPDQRIAESSEAASGSAEDGEARESGTGTMADVMRRAGERIATRTGVDVETVQPS